MNRSQQEQPDGVIEKLRECLEQLQRKFAARPTPVVTLTYAQSIDGCIAPLGGGTLQISNAATQRMTHQIRALHDAILVGVNTVICDDPRLTVRLVAGSDPQPIVLDSRLRFPLNANLLCDPCVRPIIVTGHEVCEEKSEQLTAMGAQVIRMGQTEDGLIDLWQLLPRLKQLGLRSLMVEGGSRVISEFLKSQAADQLCLAIAPRFVAGLRAVDPPHSGGRFPRLCDIQCQNMEGDIVVWARLQPADGPDSDGQMVWEHRSAEHRSAEHRSAENQD